jgi:hypothetical protein
MGFEIIGGSYSDNDKDGIHITGQSGGRIEGVAAIGNKGSGISIGAPQAIEIDDETRKLLMALTEALKRNDKTNIKKAFGYIADKSVDLAIAVVTGTLIRPAR